MKTKNDFITNSSSTSFIIISPEKAEILNKERTTKRIYDLFHAKNFTSLKFKPKYYLHYIDDFIGSDLDGWNSNCPNCGSEIFLDDDVDYQSTEMFCDKCKTNIFISSKNDSRNPNDYVWKYDKRLRNE